MKWSYDEEANAILLNGKAISSSSAVQGLNAQLIEIERLNGDNAKLRRDLPSYLQEVTGFDDFRAKFLIIIDKEFFEDGIRNQFDEFVGAQIKFLGPSCVMEWLSDGYHRKESGFSETMAILRVLSRLDYDTVNPVGAKIAEFALQSEHTHFIDLAIQAFDAWGHPDGAIALDQCRTKVKWLEDYRDKVISYLREKELK